MMRLIALVLLVWMTGAGLNPVSAQNNPPILTKPAPSPMQQTAPGQTSPTSDIITDAMAVKFYEGCRKNQGAMSAYTDAERQSFCTCVTVNMKKNIRISDIKAMQNTQTPAGKTAMAKLLNTVQFPCALPPIEQAVRAECLTRAARNPQFAAGGAQHCGCLATRMMDFVKKVGIPQALLQLRRTGQVGEPMAVLTQGDAYNAQLIKNYYTCFNGVLP